MAPPFDPASVTPLYEQAADYVAAQIAAGELRPGQKLPLAAAVRSLPRARLARPM